MNSWTENISSGRFLYIEDNSSDGGYEAKMAAAVSSPYLLAPAAVFAERKACFEYNISGLVSLDEYLAGRNLSAQDMISLLTQIDMAAAVVQNYLLSESSMLINPNYVYVDNRRNELRICVVPEYGGCFEDELKEFIMKLLPYTDTDDIPAMRTCIKLMRAVSIQDYRLHDVLEMLNNGTAAVRKNKTDTAGANIHGMSSDLYSGENVTGSRQVCSGSAYTEKEAVLTGNQGDMHNAGAYNLSGGYENSGYHDDIYRNNNDSCLGKNIFEETVNTAFKEADTAASKSSDMKKKNRSFAGREINGVDEVRLDTARSAEEINEDEAAQSPVRESITGILISQAILAGIAAMVFFVKGKTVMLRLLPIYAVMAACLIIYYVINMIMKRGKAAE